MDTIPILDATRKGVEEIFEILEKGDQQAETRDKAIAIINDLCDALQAGADLVSHELSAVVLESYSIQPDAPLAFKSFFERTAARFSSPHLRLILHEGKVCGRLHMLGDRLTQPFSPETRATVPVWDAIVAMFTRQTVMSIAIRGILEGEQEYLREFASFLDELRDLAEVAAGSVWGDIQATQRYVTDLINQVRQKRTILQRKVLAIREAADGAISAMA